MFKQMIKYLFFKRKGLELDYSTVSDVAKNFRFGKNVRLIGSNIIIKNDIFIDDYSYINTGTIIESGRIGRFCSIAHNCIIGPPEHPIDTLITHPISYHREFSKEIGIIHDNYKMFIEPDPTIIEDNVWIGANSVVLKGVRIGEGAIVAAGSIVTKDVPKYSIVAGVPARVIKDRRKEYSLEEIDLGSLTTEQILEIIKNSTKI